MVVCAKKCVSFEFLFSPQKQALHLPPPLPLIARLRKGKESTRQVVLKHTLLVQTAGQKKEKDLSTSYHLIDMFRLYLGGEK